MKRFTVALLYNLKQNAPHGEDEPWDRWNELDSEKAVAGIERALRAGGHEVIAMEGDASLPRKLQHYKIDIAFNTCEGHYGSSREAQAPALLDMLRIPYTGSGVMTLALALDKAMTKRVLSFHGLPSARFQVFTTGDEKIDPNLTYPLFAKPIREGSGIGITAKSVCRNARELREQVRTVNAEYNQPALVEEFVDGREITIGLLGNSTNGTGKSVVAAANQSALVSVGSDKSNGRALRAGGNGNGRKSSANQTTLRAFPPLEVDLAPCPPTEGGLYTSVIKSKLYEVPRYLCPAPVTKALGAKLERYALGAFKALECYDFARVDFRIDKETGDPYILEINPLAGLTEQISDLVMAAEAAGINYAALINGILDAALHRYEMI